MNKLPFAAALSALAASAFAHEGHGIPGPSHWHATDTFGLVAAVLAVAIGLWFTRGGK